MIVMIISGFDYNAYHYFASLSNKLGKDCRPSLLKLEDSKGYSVTGDVAILISVQWFEVK